MALLLIRPLSVGLPTCLGRTRCFISVFFQDLQPFQPGCYRGSLTGIANFKDPGIDFFQ